MECWTHPGVEASGMCVRCGRAACRHCLTMAGGVLFCRTCATQIQGAPADQHRTPHPADPRTRMIVSGVTALGFVIMGVATFISMANGPQRIATPPAAWVGGLLLYAWMGWSVAWTLPPILMWLHVKAVRPVVASVQMAQPGCLLTGLFVLVTFALLWYLLFWPALVVALLYGIAGGGVREMRRCRRAWAAAANRKEPGSEEAEHGH